MNDYGYDDYAPIDTGPIGDYDTGTYPSGPGIDTGPVGDYDTGTYPSGSDGGFQLPKGFSLGDIGKGIGLFNKDGTPNWGALLSLLALGGGAAYGINRNDKANTQMQDAIKNANAEATRLLGNSGAAYDPYKQAGLAGLQRLQARPDSNLAGNFQPLASQYRPLGTGAGLSLGNLARGR